MTERHLRSPRPSLSDVAFERLDGEVIAFHLGTGRYYGMSGPAADVWTLIEQGVPRDGWAAILGAAFSGAEPSASALEAFLQSCAEAQLIVDGASVPSPAGGELIRDYERSQWTDPVLEEFEDLEHLILIEPVQDTSALGWPYVTDADG